MFYDPPPGIEGLTPEPLMRDLRKMISRFCWKIYDLKTEGYEF